MHDHQAGDVLPKGREAHQHLQLNSSKFLHLDHAVFSKMTEMNLQTAWPLPAPFPLYLLKYAFPQPWQQDVQSLKGWHLAGKADEAVAIAEVIEAVAQATEDFQVNVISKDESLEIYIPLDTRSHEIRQV
jgi:hypothetical protein